MTHRVTITAAGLTIGEIVEEGQSSRLNLRIRKLLPYELIRIRDAIDLYIQSFDFDGRRLAPTEQDCSENEHGETAD